MPGARILVPFGKRELLGIITEVTDHSTISADKLKPALQILDVEPLFSNSMLQLFLWSSKYYQYPLGMLFDAVLPAWLRKQKTLELPFSATCDTEQVAPLLLNSFQENAVTAVIKSVDKFQAFLLDGVTGSGKTEVYMQLITHMVTSNKQTLILVPEINLTPQTLQRFQERFQVPIAVLHSQISEKNRASAWIHAQQGNALIVLGTRLAAFTPLKNPGLFIIDEEHDLAFKQQDHFRYSARDLLLKRAQLERCPIILGTATPSLESWHNVIAKKFHYLQLPERAGTAQKPTVEILDIRHKQLDEGISNELLSQIKQQLDNNQQVLLFLNRRGYAPVLMCCKCGWHITCKRCDSNMILHHDTQILRCHHCEAQNVIPNACTQCGDINITAVGLGTQRLELCLSRHFPNAKIVRVDKDSVHNKKQLKTVLDSVHDGSTNILIGTQMLSKGHHFPNLGLVAIVDIDAALFSADFRATERIGQLITQVAGRTGRGDKLGKVVLQTTHPDNKMLQTLIYQGYHQFLELLIQERKLTGLPPYSYQVLFRAETKTPAIAGTFLKSVKKMITANTQKISCLGPIPAPMEKRQGFYRAQLLLQADSRQALQSQLHSVIPQIEASKQSRSVRWSIDVDPLEMF
jgi:primosomal protein N' (replication factor Y)